MKKKNTLKIHLLGEFYIENNQNHFPQEIKKSKQLIVLIAYLIIFRHTVVTKNKLIEILWPNDESDNPEGALRNLVYRARREMVKFFPNSNKQCIISKGNTYAWNPEIDCIIDVDEMEHLCKLIEVESDLDKEYAYCMELMTRYNQEFMFEFLEEEWVILQKNYYDNVFMRTVEKVCKNQISHDRYQEIIQLCNQVEFKYYANNHIYEYKLYALYQINQTSTALSYYHKVIDIYYSKFGLEPTKNMKKIYRMLLERSIHKPVDVDELAQALVEQDDDQGTFYCDFDVFKKIYQMNVRSARRSSKLRYLVLLTLVNKGEAISNDLLNKESDILKDVILADLRKNDVFSKCNPTQYSLIISTPSEEGCHKAVSRIIQRFEGKRQLDTLQIHYDIKNIA